MVSATTPGQLVLRKAPQEMRTQNHPEKMSDKGELTKTPEVQFTTGPLSCSDHHLIQI